jgi:hypothetical protein
MEQKVPHPNMIEKTEHLFHTAFQYVQTRSQPSQDPMTRMFATRAASLICAVAETALIIFKTVDGWNVIGRRYFCAKQAADLPFTHDVRIRRDEIGRLVLGLLGTLLLGIVFSPMGNCRLHVRLQLIKDLAAEHTQMERQAKMQAEEKKRDLEQARAARFSQVEAEPGKREGYVVEARLKSLLT